jgi:hypothetical protein
VQAAQVLLMRRPRAAMRSLWPWSSRHRSGSVLTIALANKLALAWAVLARGCAYQPKVAAMRWMSPAIASSWASS